MNYRLVPSLLTLALTLLPSGITADPPEIPLDEYSFQATAESSTTLGLALSSAIESPAVPAPAPGELWQGWGVIPTETPPDSCEALFANLPRSPLACYADDLPQPQDPLDDLPEGELAYRALALTTIDGAGLQVQPHIRAYVGVPTLVHATHPERETTVDLLGHPVHVRFTASSYSYSFNDGSDPLVTNDPSGPFPISRLRHIYQEPFPSQTITLETIWSAHITHPKTGHIITLNNAFTTRETSQPFEVRKAKGYLTDTAEELMGR